MLPEREQSLKVVIFLNFISFLIALYLTHDHFNTGPSVCDSTNTSFSCSVVNRSPFSELWGVPVAVYGALWSAALIYGCWKILIGDKPHHHIVAVFLWCILGLLFVVYMIIAELILGSLCIFCTAVHIITAISFYFSLRLYMDMKVKPNFGNFLHTMRYVIFVVIVVFLVPVFLYSLHQPKDVPKLTRLATCMAEKNIQMFGSDYCHACQRQKSAFGPEAFQFILYTDCRKSEENSKICIKQNMFTYPTWVKYGENGEELERREGVQGLHQLEEFSGCKVSEEVEIQGEKVELPISD